MLGSTPNKLGAPYNRGAISRYVEMLGEGLTMPAIGDTDGNRLTVDNEANWHPCLAEEMRVYGSRRVENLIAFSEDMTQGNYSVLNSAVVDSATQVTYDGTANGNVYNSVTITDKGAGRTFVFSVNIRVVSGTISGLTALQIFVRGNAVTETFANIGDSVDSTTKRFTITATTDATGTIVRPEVRWDDAGVLEITEWQLEESTGRSDVSTPSEYVPSGVATGGAEIIESFGDGATPPDVSASYDGTNITNAESTATAQIISPTFSIVENYTYIVTFNCTVNAGAISSSTLKTGSNSALTTNYGLSETFADGANSFVFKATGSSATARIGFRIADAGLNFDITDWSFSKIDHGANVDSVKTFDYENPFTVASNIVTDSGTLTPIVVTKPNYVDLPGASGDYVSTPDSAALDITGDIEIIAYVAADDWTPAALGVIFAKWTAAGAQRSIALYVRTDGKLAFALTPDGATPSTAVSSAATGFTDGTGHWIRVKWSDTLDDANFYTSDDACTDGDTSGITWTQLGTADRTLVCAGIYSSTAPLSIGEYSLAGGSPFAGNIYRCEVYDGLTVPPADVGVELWDDAPDTVGSGWTDNGDGSYTCDGTDNVSIDILTDEIVDGGTYIITGTCDAYTSGTFNVYPIGAANRGNSGNITSTGDFVAVTQINTATSLSPKSSIQLFSQVSFNGTVSNISVKRIDPSTKVADFNPGLYSAFTDPKNITTPYEFGLLPGASGDYFSTPDAAVLDITGGIDLIAHMSAVDLTTGSIQVLVGKWTTTGNQRSYYMYINGGGLLGVSVSADGAYDPANDALSTADIPALDGDSIWVRATWLSGTATFYTSADGISWTQLGDTATTSSTSLYVGTSPLYIGAQTVNLQRLEGKVHRAIVKNGIDGEVVSDFYPERDFVSGTTMTANGTDEVWTANGDAAYEYDFTVNGDAYLHSDASPINYLQPQGYMAEGQAVELSGYSADLGNWSAVTTATVAQDAVGLTGEPNEAFTITDSDGAAVQARQQNTAIADDSLTHYMISRVAYDSSPSVYSQVRLRISGGTTLEQAIIFNPSDGSYVPRTGGYEDGAVVSVTRDGDWWEIVQSLTNNTTGNTSLSMVLAPAFNSDASGNAAAAAQGSTVFASCELYKTTYSHSPLLTTGGTTKTRLTDREATIPASYFSDGVGSISFELTPYFASIPSAMGIVSVSGALDSFLSFSSVAKRISIYDGTNGAYVLNSYSSAGQTVTVKARWNSSTTKDISVDRVANTGGSTAFDGSFNPSGDITLFKSLTQGACISNIKFYANDLGSDWLS